MSAHLDLVYGRACVMTARSAVDREVARAVARSAALARAWPRRPATSTTSQPARPAGCCVAVAASSRSLCPWGRLREDRAGFGSLYGDCAEHFVRSAPVTAAP
jgi:hypothetical protein